MYDTEAEDFFLTNNIAHNIIEQNERAAVTRDTVKRMMSEKRSLKK